MLLHPSKLKTQFSSARNFAYILYYIGEKQARKCKYFSQE